MDGLITKLKNENYCLILNEDGSEMYDDQRNLLVCKSESEEFLSIPNNQLLRSLYNLPIEEGNGNNYQENDENGADFIWTVHKTGQCNEAAKVLLELIGSPKYLNLLKDRSTIKLKVWEQIALEIEKRGFKIATTTQKAGLRAFQKWRNMERNYRDYYKNPDQFGEGKRRQKPRFFDDIQIILHKLEKSAKEHSKVNSTRIDEQATNRLRPGELSTEAVEVLLNLVNSEKYCGLFGESVMRKSMIWINISQEMEAMGIHIPGDTKYDKSKRIHQKLKNLKKAYMDYQIAKGKGIMKKKPMLYKLLRNTFFNRERGQESADKKDNFKQEDFAQLEDHDYKSVLSGPETSQEAGDINTGDFHNISASENTASPGSHSSKHSANYDITELRSISPELIQSASTSVTVTAPISKQQTTNNELIEILLQIKSLHEKSITYQQEHFKKITSLLEDQIKCQNQLNVLFAQYAKNNNSSKNSK